MTEENKGLSRRTVVKGAAWSVPVIAAAVATPLASASVLNSDLVASFAGPITLGLTLPVVGNVASINTVNTLTVTNNGTTASPAGATVTVAYDSSLLTLNITGAGISVLGSDGNFTVTLPAIQPGTSLTINLGTTLDSALNLNILTGLLGGDPETMTATIAGDDVTSNNVTSQVVGITLL